MVPNYFAGRQTVRWRSTLYRQILDELTHDYIPDDNRLGILAQSAIELAPDLWAWPMLTDTDQDEDSDENTMVTESALWQTQEFKLESQLYEPLAKSLELFLGESWSVMNTFKGGLSLDREIFGTNRPDFVILKKTQASHTAINQIRACLESGTYPLTIFEVKIGSLVVSDHGQIIRYLLAVKKNFPNKRVLGVLFSPYEAVAYQFFGSMLLQATFDFRQEHNLLRLYQLIRFGYLVDTDQPNADVRLGSFSIVQRLEDQSGSFARDRKSTRLNSSH